MQQGKLVAKSQGMPGLAIAEYPGTMMTDSMEQLVEKVETALMENVIRSLTAAPAQETQEPESAEPEKRDVIFRGDLDAVNDYFYERLWTDGLPIVPPTAEKIEAFLKFTERSPDEIISLLPHEQREATVWNVAVNGVMAGCRPEYMPVLLGIADAISDPVFQTRDVGSTPGWEPLVIVTGPITKELDFNCGQGILRFGRRANTSIGRFLKLFLRNVAGFRLPPGVGDKGSIGQSMNVAIAENEDVVQEIGWTPFSVDHGFAKGDNTVTVMSSAYVSPPTYSAGSTALEHVETIAEGMARRSCSAYAVWGVYFTVLAPLFMISPAVARIIAKDGWSKADISAYMHENIKEKAAYIEKHGREFNGKYLDLCKEVNAGRLPKEYCESCDPERLIKSFPSPGSVQIIVGGDPDRNQSKAFMQSGGIGYPVTRKIVLPADWKDMLAK
ncbi:MAG: hypothetical protein LBU86_02705 [Oscillospiraceae bacterium]|jgi:hypothetical protein|nr:hypothetical protein [Oscillospiraceae bacterium]